jgi:hypothetical protein
MIARPLSIALGVIGEPQRSSSGGAATAAHRGAAAGQAGR